MKQVFGAVQIEVKNINSTETLFYRGEPGPKEGFDHLVNNQIHSVTDDIFEATRFDGPLMGANMENVFGELCSAILFKNDDPHKLSEFAGQVLKHRKTDDNWYQPTATIVTISLVNVAINGWTSMDSAVIYERRFSAQKFSNGSEVLMPLPF